MTDINAKPDWVTQVLTHTPLGQRRTPPSLQPARSSVRTHEQYRPRWTARVQSPQDQHRCRHPGSSPPECWRPPQCLDRTQKVTEDKRKNTPQQKQHNISLLSKFIPVFCSHGLAVCRFFAPTQAAATFLETCWISKLNTKSKKSILLISPPK